MTASAPTFERAGRNKAHTPSDAVRFTPSPGGRGVNFQNDLSNRRAVGRLGDPML